MQSPHTLALGRARRGGAEAVRCGCGSGSATHLAKLCRAPRPRTSALQPPTPMAWVLPSFQDLRLAWWVCPCRTKRDATRRRGLDRAFDQGVVAAPKDEATGRCDVFLVTGMMERGDAAAAGTREGSGGIDRGIHNQRTFKP